MSNNQQQPSEQPNNEQPDEIRTGETMNRDDMILDARIDTATGRVIFTFARVEISLAAGATVPELSAVMASVIDILDSDFAATAEAKRIAAAMAMAGAIEMIRRQLDE